MRVAFEQPDQECRDRSQQHDPPGKREAIAPEAELAWHVAVLGEKRCEPRKCIEAGVRRQEENQGGRGLEGVKEWGACPEDNRGDQRDHGLTPRLGRKDAEAVRNHRHPEEQDTQQDGHCDERCCGVLRFRRLERGDAVGDRLGPRQRDRTRRERLEEEEDSNVVRAEGHGLLLNDVDGRAGHDPEYPDPDHEEGQAQEEVGRDGEDVARLTEATEIGDRNEGDGDDSDLDPDVIETREDRIGLRDGRCCRDRHSHHIVDEEGRRGDQRGDRSDVLLRHGIGATAVGIGATDLSIGQGNDRQEHADRYRNRD